jgi:hypothetical protein
MVLALSLVLGLGLAFLAPLAAAQNGRRIMLHGAARVELHAGRKSGRLVVSGRAVDDAGKSLETRVVLTLERDGAKVPLSGGSAELCEGFGAARASALVDETGAILAQTTEDGRFCARLLVPTDRYVVHAQVPASELVDGAEALLAVDSGRTAVALHFDPERPVLWLDGSPVTIDAVAAMDDDDTKTGAGGLALELSNETGATFGRATTDDLGHARFVVEGAKLGAPGRGELRLGFAGNAEAGASQQALRVERRTHIDLTAPDARRSPGSPEDGIELRVQAAARCAKQGCPGSPTGTVEARLGEAEGRVVGAASVERGEARVVATFPMPASTSVKLYARYAPDAPWFVPGEELELEQPLQPPTPWKKLPLALAALALLALVALARLPARARRGVGSGEDDGAHGPGVGIAIVRETTAAEGWSGTIIDAHDGFAVPAARVTIERRGMLSIEAVAQAVSDAHGAFSLGSVVARPGDELVAEGPLHAPLRRPLPKSGVLKVALLQRKRALLNELVDWVKKRGDPFTFKGEPTPGELSAFAAMFRQDVSEWANAVERAAYGGSPVDAAAHEAVSGLAPVEPDDTRAGPVPEDLPKSRPKGHGGGRGLR